MADSFLGTPGGLGLLPTAVSEAEVAIQHAELAVRTPWDLGAVRRHVEGVRLMISPTLGGTPGPGPSFGVRRAAEEIAERMGLATEDEEASDNLRTHARHIAGAARAVVARVDRIVTLAARIEDTTSSAAVASDLEELHTLTRALFFGREVDGDGRVGWAEPEGGLRQAQWHMTLLKRGEGLAP